MAGRYESWEIERSRWVDSRRDQLLHAFQSANCVFADCLCFVLFCVVFGPVNKSVIPLMFNLHSPLDSRPQH